MVLNKNNIQNSCAFRRNVAMPNAVRAEMYQEHRPL